MFPARIVAIGASTFFGRVDPEGGGFIGRLKTWHEGNHRKNCVFNLGISSETSTDLLKRLVPECTPRKPDLIILGCASANDARRQGSPSAPPSISISNHEKNIQSLVSAGMRFCPIMAVSGHPTDDRKTNPMHGTDKYFASKELEMYRNSSKAIYLKNGIPYLDIYDEWIKRDYNQWLADDGLHPNSLGHEKIFEALKVFLIKHFGA